MDGCDVTVVGFLPATSLLCHNIQHGNLTSASESEGFCYNIYIVDIYFHFSST